MSKFFVWLKANPVLAGIAGVVVAMVVVAGVVIGVTGGSSNDRSAAPTETGPMAVTPGESGRVDVNGPAGIVLTGLREAADADNWIITVDGGRGSVGGFDLRTEDFSGTISSSSGQKSAQVTVALTNHPDVVPQWEQSATLAISYAPATETLVGAISSDAAPGTIGSGTASPESTNLSMTGPLDDDGGYTLAATGMIGFAGSRIPLSGTYEGAAVDGPETRWLIEGEGAPGVVGGGAPTGPTMIAMTEAAPGVTGWTSLQPSRTDFSVPCSLWFVDEGDWQLDASGSSTQTWSPELVPTLTVDTGSMSGTVASRNGVISWNLATNMRLFNAGLTLDGSFNIDGLTHWVLDVTGGEGEILGLGQPIESPEIRGSVVFDAGSIEGSVSVVAGGVKLLELPDGWTPVTALSIGFSNAGGQLDTSTTVAAYMTNRSSRSVRSGQFQGENAFALTVGGNLQIAQTAVPLVGRYESVGYMSNGAPRTTEYWNFSGDLGSIAGGVPLATGGFGIKGGSIGMASTTAAQPVSTPLTPFVETRRASILSNTVQPAMSETEIEGAIEVALDDYSDFLKSADLKYTDEDNWFITLTIDGGPAWTVPGFNNLIIDADTITGTVESEDGELTWDVSIDELVWTNMTTGVVLTTGFSVGDTCPLEENCIDDEGIYVGWNNGEMDLPDGLPTLGTDGAFLTDGTWARMTGVAPNAEFDNFSITDPTMTIWKGERSDSFDANMEMPDLSSANNGLNFEFCGGFEIHIPDIPSQGTSGCAEWTPDGFVIAQVAVGGDVDAGESNGVSLESSALTGWAYTTLTTKPSVNLYGEVLQLLPELNQFTAELVMPGIIMDKVGLDDSLSNIGATGWFDDTDFSLDGALDVNMSNGGFSLNTITVHISKDGSDFELGFGAESMVSVDGNKFPMNAYIGLVLGSTTELTISLDVTGTQAAQPAGTFDLPTLIPTGDFEPDDKSTIDGSFDSRQTSSIVTHGDFENASEQANLLSNSDFESGTGKSLLDNGDFEDGSTGDVLPNGDFEQFDISDNGDFEDGDYSGWGITSSYQMTQLADTAPSEDEGAYAYNLKNNFSSSIASQTTSTGLYQNITWNTVQGAQYTYSVWAKSNDTSNGRLRLWVDQKGTVSGCSTQSAISTGSDIFTVTPTWQQFSFTITGNNSCRSSFTITASVVDSQDIVELDTMSFEAKLGSTTWLSGLPNIAKPDVQYSGVPSGNVIVRREPSLAHAGDGYLAATGTSSNWDFYWSTLESPTQYSSWTFNVWVKCRSCASTTGNVYMFTQGGSEDNAKSSAPVTITQTWQRFSLTMYMRNSGHSDLRVGFMDIALANSEILFDDWSLQPVGWTPSPTPTANGTSQGAVALSVLGDGTISRTDQGAMELISRPTSAASGQGGYVDMAAPTQGATYTASVWVKSPAAASSAVSISAYALGGTVENFDGPATNITTGWTQLTLTFTVANGGHTGLRLAVYNRLSASAAAPKTIHFDDVTISGAPLAIAQDADSVWNGIGSTDFQTLPPISLSNSNNVYLTSDIASVANTGNSLRSDGNGDWWFFNTDSYGYANGDFDMSVDVYFPASNSRDIADIAFWSKGAGTAAAGYAYRLDSSSNYNSGFITYNGGSRNWVSGSSQWRTPPLNVWHRVRLTAVGDSVTVTVTRLDTNAVEKTETVTMPSGNRAGSFGQAYDAASSTLGSRWDNFQILSGSNTNTVYDDSSKAHGGAGYLQVKGGTSNSSATRTTTTAPIQGSTYTASAWVRSSGGTNVSGKLTAKSAGTSDTVNTSFTATSTWQQVSVALPINSAGATGITMQIDNNTSGQGLLVDDVGIQLQGLTQPQPWGVLPGSGGSIATAIWNDPAKAHGGDDFLSFTAKSVAGSVFSSNAFTPVAGDAYTASVWVRSDSNTNVNGQLGISAEGTTTEQRWQNFTATGTWQQVFVSLPITVTTNTNLRLYVKATTTNVSMRVDDAEMRKITTWGLAQPSGTLANEIVLSDREQAAEGTGFARVSTSGANAGIVATQAQNITAGSTWTLKANVRSTNGSNLNGQLKATASGTSGETFSLPFTANADWQPVEFSFKATKANTAMTVEAILGGSGMFDIDGISITQDVIVQSDPWSSKVGSGGSSSWVVKADSSRSHDSYGVMQIATTGTSESGITHAITEQPSVGNTYTGTVWVRSSSGTPVNGRYFVSANGGTVESASANFTATSSWQQVSFKLPINNANHNSMTASVVITTPGVTLDVDDVILQKFVWAPFGAATQTQVNDSASAQSGSGFVRIQKSTGDAGGIQLDTSGNLTTGTSQTMTAWVRSATGSNLSGHMTLSGVGGSGQDTATANFTATTSWKKVSVTVSVSQAGQTALRSKFFVDATNAGLEIDSVNVAQEPLGAPDGVTTPLPHPESGYVYLWDDAFGIPGAHLWAMSAEVGIINGRPALGIAATVYFDPTKATSVMSGTDWLKGDLVANISTAAPCFQFGFDATGTNARVGINGGVFETSQFLLSWAPRGCSVGQYEIAPGSVFTFDAEMGDALLHFDLEIGRDDNDLPTFYTEMRVQNLKLAGTTYNNMELIVDISADAAITTFTGDFTLPMGQMNGDFDLTVGANGLHMAGQVTLSDWKMAGGSFDIETFNYYQSVDVGGGQCGAFSAGLSGKMSMGSKKYDFSGNMTVDCGQLSVFHLQFQYMKKSISYQFNLDYSSTTHVLSGGLTFKFERSTSWKFLSHRYRRHPKFVVHLDFSMDFDNPGNGKLNFYGSISVSGGSGSLGCSLNANGDDSCSLYVRVNIFGGHTYRSSW